MLTRVFLLKVFSNLYLPTAVIVAGLFLVWRSVGDLSKLGGQHNSVKSTAGHSRYGGAMLVSGVRL